MNRRVVETRGMFSGERLTAIPSDGSSLITVYREALASLHYARRTIGTYERWLWRYLRFDHLRHPREMGGPEINAFLTHLAVMEHVSASSRSEHADMDPKMSCLPRKNIVVDS